MNTVLVRFGAGGAQKLERGVVSKLDVGDKFTLSTTYYEFLLCEKTYVDVQEPEEDELEATLLRFAPKSAEQSLEVPPNTPHSLSNLGGLSRLPSALAAIPSESPQFQPKPALGEPLTPTNTPQMTINTSPQTSGFFEKPLPASRGTSNVGEIDLLGNDNEDFIDVEGESTGPISLPLPSVIQRQQAQQEILKSSSVNDLFLSSEAILAKVDQPLQLRYEHTPAPSPISSTPTKLERREPIPEKLKEHLNKDFFENYECSLQIETDEEASEASESGKEETEQKSPPKVIPQPRYN